MECPFCFEPVHEDATACKSCGAVKKNYRENLVFVYFAYVIGLVMILLAAGEPDGLSIIVPGMIILYGGAGAAHLYIRKRTEDPIWVK